MFDQEFIKQNIFKIRIQLQEAIQKATCIKLKDRIKLDLKAINKIFERVENEK